MKRRDLIKKLLEAGWMITTGGNHDMAEHPNKPGKIPIPRHNEINEYTAKGILKDAVLEYPRS
ncbi:MAG: type II toxin-antitoxin system HicA family toxin [Clostridia bacterium]|nr:type II toxin-antitoxin system HicA family toxin [Clostridia bacterium]